MKYLVFIVLLVVSFSQVVSGNSDMSNPILNSDGLTYDSIMQTINRKDVSFKDKYDLVKSEMTSLYPMDKTTEIFQKVLILAKKEKANTEILGLYVSIAYNFGLVRNPDIMKLYLDSASVYEDKVNDPNILGVYNLVQGSYYSLREQEELSFRYNYKAIDCFEKSGGKNYLIVSILFDMLRSYQKTGSSEDVKSIVDKMKIINKKDMTFHSNIMTNQSISVYYSILYDKHGEMGDSCQYYNLKTINIFETASIVEQHTAIQQIIWSYTSAVTMELCKTYPNWGQVSAHIAKMEELCSPSDSSRLVWIHNVKAKMSIKQKNYTKAEQELKTSMYILDNQTVGRSKTQYHETYAIFCELYEAKGDYKNALKYKNMEIDTKLESQEEDRYEIIKEMDLKYDIAQKDLEISQLNEREQQLLYNRTLIITISIIGAILLLLALLYYRYQRQLKEKEAILKDKRIEEKEYEYQVLLKETENKQMRHYLDGLEAERTRLAKELHDNVANELYVATMELNSLESTSDGITDKMKNLHTQIRAISHDLMPPQFQYASLLDILYNHLIVMEKQTDIHFQLDVKNGLLLENIPPTLSHELYRIIQECTGNIIKHSSAKNATISLLDNDGSIKLMVEDDGKGFNTSAAHRGIGLHIIKERCNSLGGSLHVDSEIGHGCTVTILIPLNDSEMQ